MLHEITHTSIGLEDIHPPAFWELLDEIKREYKEKLVAGEVDKENDDYGCAGQYVNKSGSLASVATSAADILGGNGINNLALLGTQGSESECGASKGRKRRGNWKRKSGKNSAGFTSNVPKKEKKRPMLKGAKMIDKRTKIGKAAMAERENLTARELAAKAALARFGNSATTSSADAAKESTSSRQEIAIDDSIISDEDECNDERKPIKNGEGHSSSDEEDEEEDEPIREHNSGCGCRSCDWSKLFHLE